jgi:hypothetical protein
MSFINSFKSKLSVSRRPTAASVVESQRELMTVVPQRFMSLFEMPDKVQALLESKRAEHFMFGRIQVGDVFVSDVVLLDSANIHIMDAQIYCENAIKLHGRKFKMKAEIVASNEVNTMVRIAPADFIVYFKLCEVYNLMGTEKLAYFQVDSQNV